MLVYPNVVGLGFAISEFNSQFQLVRVWMTTWYLHSHRTCDKLRQAFRGCSLRLHPCGLAPIGMMGLKNPEFKTHIIKW